MKELRYLFLMLFVFALMGCDTDERQEGIAWQHGGEEALSPAFGNSSSVPAYARAWRMPMGFIGFPERWNEQVRRYVETSLEEATEECEKAWTIYLTQAPGSAKHRAAFVRLKEARQELASLIERRRMGDYLVFAEEHALPDNLDWQFGGMEPELGSPEAKKGGTMRMSIQRAFPGTLRPFGPNSNNATRRYVYDDIDMPLVRLHPGTFNLIPGTADRWAISPDGRTVYFHIDDHARFSDGSRLTTRDFITSLFIRTSPYAAEPFYKGYYMGNFARITVYGDKIFAVTLVSPKPYAPYYASIPASCTPFYGEFGPDYPVRYLWRVAPTTGGYTITETGLVMGRSLTLSRVRDWWAADRRYTRYSCNVDNMVYSFVSEMSKAQELFRIGQLDVLTAANADFWYEGLEIDDVHRGYIQRVQFDNIWPRSCFGIHLNCSRAPLTDIHVRRGFHHSMNISRVIDSVFRGDYNRSGSYFMGFGKYTNNAVKALPFSPEKARECFAKAGYTEEDPDGILKRPDGKRLEVVLSMRIDPLNASCMNILRDDAADCGLDLQVEVMDDTVFYLKVKEKAFSSALFSWGFSPPLPDPAPFFYSRYAMKEDRTPLPNTSNITATASAELDAAILDTRRAASEEEAIRAHHRVQELIAETCAWVPGWSAGFRRFAQWRWVRWPDTPECRFCPPGYYDPLDSHLYWIDNELYHQVQRFRKKDATYPEEQVDIPLPPPFNTPATPAAQP